MIDYESHPEVRRDLDDIWEFISKGSPDAADRLISDILSAMDTLVPFPHRGHNRSGLTSGPCATFFTHISKPQRLAVYVESDRTDAVPASHVLPVR